MSFVSRNHPQQTGRRGPLDEVDDRGTDPAVFAELSGRFGGFTVDVAAAAHNAKCERWHGRAGTGRGRDGLRQSWEAERVWCNPPYSDIGAWVRKAWAEWDQKACPCGEVKCPEVDHLFWPRGIAPELIVMLLPANRTEQKWWQELVEPHRDRSGSPLRVEFLPGRMRFVRPGAETIGPNERPPFGCCLLVWRSV